MNLKEFIAYRDTCPMCDTKLTLCFHSKKQQKVKYDGDIISFDFRMDSLQKRSKTSNKVTFVIDQQNNTWFVNFSYTNSLLSGDNKIQNFISFEMMKRFKDMNNHLSPYIFYKYCNKCECYNYRSNMFFLSFKNCSFGDLEIRSEYFGISVPLETGYKNFRLSNSYYEDRALSKSRLVCSKDLSNIWAKSNSSYSANNYLELPLINFSNSSSKEDIVNRLERLILFS
jgi:hypothetical protein